MKKRVVLFLLTIIFISINIPLSVKADTSDVYEDEVIIRFENETQESTGHKDINQDQDLIIGKPTDKNRSKLPQTGQMVTSIIVLLMGIIIILLFMLIYLIRDINKIKRIEGN